MRVLSDYVLIEMKKQNWKQQWSVISNGDKTKLRNSVVNAFQSTLLNLLQASFKKQNKPPHPRTQPGSKTKYKIPKVLLSLHNNPKMLDS